MIPGNPYAEALPDKLGFVRDHADRAKAIATLALAYEQHQRNRLAAITATHRGLELPADLAALAIEGTQP